MARQHDMVDGGVECVGGADVKMVITVTHSFSAS